MSFFVLRHVRCALEKQADTPQTGKRDNNVNYPARGCRLTAEDPCDDIKLKESDGTPVERSYDDESE